MAKRCSRLELNNQQIKKPLHVHFFSFFLFLHFLDKKCKNKKKLDGKKKGKKIAPNKIKTAIKKGV